MDQPGNDYDSDDLSRPGFLRWRAAEESSLDALDDYAPATNPRTKELTWTRSHGLTEQEEEPELAYSR